MSFSPSDMQNMISVKDAVQRAATFARDLSSDDKSPWAKDIRLEEVEQDELKGAKVWLITLSAPTPTIVNFNERLYKVFAVDRVTGEVLSMKIREFAGTHV